MRTSTQPRAVAVAVDGTAGDAPALRWAAEQAARDHRPLILAHAAGHLPPDMTYGERHVARSERMARGERLMAAAARYVHGLVPGVAVTTTVRLLHQDALLQAISEQASLLTGVAPSWQRARQARNTVIAAVDDATADAHVVHFATEYAAYRGLDLEVIENPRDGASRQLLQAGHSTSILLMPRPEPGAHRKGFDWPTALHIVQQSEAPVVLVSAPPPC